ncbi:MAG: RNA-binding protein [Gammaproteobacteria bacterium]|nr:RNA-binding protein [Gammaproteobacteria bacterium]MBK6583087.1 RNA-binding protein [Gammaproteobacteria bacterium]MBK7519216.1 RNA-binding protein [Gammaproteobacteria bacterium]MBK7730044.1 RNA-binding protein [Gammaproteobacteria bacterium]MBK8305861.1 RNA-binding protein [Gammaproteobacteria bacterium]
MPEQRVRLDKWLWAARFFRTRNLARQSIEGGKVWYDGARAKVSKEVRIGAELRIRQGFDEKTVTVLALAEERRGAPEAARLYGETAASIGAREQRAEQRKFERAGAIASAGRPDKRERRLIHRFRERQSDS